VKRKTPPPPLDEDVVKRNKEKASAGAASSGTVSIDDKMKTLIEEKASTAVKERVVYKITGLPEGLKWGEIKDSMKEETKAEGPIFIVHQDGATEAHVSAFNRDGNAEKFEDAADKKKLIKDTEYTLTKVTDEAEIKAYWMDQFTANPPKDIEKELNKLKSAAHKAKRDGARGDPKKRRAPSGPVSIGGTTYASKDEVMAKASEIAKKNPGSEMETLAGADAEFAMALLDFHPKAGEKKKALKELAVGTNPEFPTTRCFFAVQEDGSKIDFSYIKCIGAIPEDTAAEGAAPAAKKAKKTE